MWDDEIREDQSGGSCDMNNAYKILIGKSKGKRPLEET
jgi:hypothetical protein